MKTKTKKMQKLTEVREGTDRNSKWVLGHVASTSSVLALNIHWAPALCWVVLTAGDKLVASRSIAHSS